MRAFRILNLFALVWCFGVVVFGAYVRLSDAGLGCPDWPGCYGHVDVPLTDSEVATAESQYPERPVEAPKAWKEMIHRYIASALGLWILALAVLAWLGRRQGAPFKTCLALVGLVCFQGVLGMWTVTWQLKPLAVTGHLLGGMSTLALLFWTWISTHPARWSGISKLRAPTAAGLRPFAWAAVLVVAIQIFLGGWTSTNYAALACPDLPTCHGQWLPDTDYREAYTLWRGLGVNYEYGVLDSVARITVHFTHRVGAIVVSLVLLCLAIMLLKTGPLWRKYGIAVLLALGTQVAIGLLIVAYQLPLLLADAHNAGAAVLLLTTLGVLRASYPVTREAAQG